MEPIGPLYINVADFVGYRIGWDGSFWSGHLRGSKGKRFGTWVEIKPCPNGDSGHLYVRLAREGRQHKRYVHRLVLEAFVGPCPSGLECCHDDGDPTNNRVSNLYWGTRKQNCADTARHGRAHRGDRHRFAKLQERDIPVLHELRAEFPSATAVEFGVLFGVSESTIRSALKGRNWAWLKPKEVQS